LATLVAIGATACGSSSNGSARWTRTHALTYAAKVNLRPADVPGFSQATHQETAADRQNVAELARCAGAVDPSLRIAHVPGESFARGSGIQTEQVGSTVDVYPSASQTRQDFAKFGATSARTCVSAYVARSLAGSSTNPNVKFGTADVSTLAPPAGTAAGSFGYRLVVPLTASGTSVTFYFDLLFHRSGPAEVSFQSLGVGSPFPAAAEQHLFKLLVTRADAGV
jgi:hypothetical protein